MRICFVSHEYAYKPPFGGVASYTLNTARWLAAHGHDVHVVCPTRTETPQTLQDMDVNLHLTAPKRIRPRRILKYLSRLPGLGFMYEAFCGWNLVEDSAGVWHTIRALSRQCKFDIIECSDFRGLAFWGLILPKRTHPIMIRGHGYLDLTLPNTNFPGRYFHHSFERFCLQRADFVVTNSRFLASVYKEKFGVHPKRLGCVYYGFHLTHITHTSAHSLDLSPRNNSDGKPVVFIYIGSLDYLKGTDVLFEALQIAHQKFPFLKAVFVGKLSDNVADRYQRFFSEAADWASHIGSVPPDAVWSSLAESNVLTLPSRSETFGRVLVEAQLAGLPVIGSRIGGIPEIIAHEQTGLLVESGNALELANAMLTLCYHPELRVEMGRRGHEIARERFAMDSVMEQQMTVYRALIEGCLSKFSVVEER